MIFGLTYSSVYPAISGVANLGVTYLPELFNVNHWLLIIFLPLFSLLLFYRLEKKGEPRQDRETE